MAEPLIIQYSNLLHRVRDPESQELQRFIEQHKDDPKFVERAQKLNRLFVLKQQLVGARG